MTRATEPRRFFLVTIATIVTCLAGVTFATNVGAASWNGIEPLKTRREDVVKILGQPTSESPDGALRFSVSGGTVQISFVNEKFVTSKKLKPEFAGTVLEIVLQHEHSSDTAESMKLLTNRAFIRDDVRNISVFRNVKDGVVYTFIDGNLKTTRYTFADGQLFRSRH
jgi:hypothetical protein